MLAIRNSCFYILVFTLFSLAGKAQEVKEPTGKNNIAYKWGEVALTATANDTEKFKPRPTVTSRILGLIWTAVFDAPAGAKADSRPHRERRVGETGT